MDNFIKSSFGINCKIEKAAIKGLSLYLTAGREFFTVSMDGFSFLLVQISSDDRFGAIALEKQLALLRKAQDCEVAFAFESLTKLQREALLSRRIPFVAGSDQIYLPFLGIVLRNNFKSRTDVPAEKMTPASQSLFLYLLYNKQDEYVLKKQAADALGLTGTSITRASQQLNAMGIITEEAHGKEIRMKPVASGFELYLEAKPYLITPVQKRFYTKSTSSHAKMFLAGESALSKETMLGQPKYSTVAVYKGDASVKELKEIDIKWQETADAVLVELWKYDPVLFAKDDIVDPVSLAVSLSDNDDERVQGELDSFMEEYKW